MNSATIQMLIPQSPSPVVALQYSCSRNQAAEYDGQFHITLLCIIWPTMVLKIWPRVL